ncbi:MAG: DUF996 domain-containing protein [Caldisphaeraceae archaeon]|nr:DUF996 domain-containing protein [Caldisphaeraceae archaeon]
MVGKFFYKGLNGMEPGLATAHGLQGGLSQKDSNEIRSAADRAFYGIILIILGFVPYVGTILSIIGLILLLISLNDFSKALNNKSILENAIKAVVSGIVLFILAMGIELLGFSAGIFAPTFIITVIIFYAAAIAIGYFYREVYRNLASSLKENLKDPPVEEFENAAKWYWYGGLTTIIIVGVVFSFIADIYALLGYRELSKGV